MFSILATRMLTTISRREFVVPITSFYKYKKEIFAQNESVLSTVFYHRASSIEKYEDLRSIVMSSQNPKIKFPNKRKLSKNSRKKIAISQNNELLQKAIVVYNCTSKSVENLPTYSSDMLTLNSCGDPTIPHLQSNALTCTLKSSIVDFTKSTKTHEAPDKQPADEPKEKLRMLSSKLRNEIPMFFEKKGPWHDFNIYTKQIGLYISGHKNPEKLSLFLSGLRSYKLFVWLYRQINLRYLSQPTL
uniref:Uncharacterized protein n=1 Tax=Ciona savignyi TaxID=51511 RepID=H2Y8P8_CIOSA